MRVQERGQASALDRRFRSTQRDWERLGERDPFWAVLTEPGTRGNRWDVEAFFATGREAVARELQLLAERGFAAPRGRALDFGCGLGRLTQALAEHFESVVGIDISSTMIEKARRLNRAGDRCRFLHSPRRDLSPIESGSIDFALSHIALQHVPPDATERYIQELVRVLSPAGILVFGLPSVLAGGWKGAALRCIPERIANAARRKLLGFEMHGRRREEVNALIASAGGDVIDHREETTGHWVYVVYTARRAGSPTREAR